MRRVPLRYAILILAGATALISGVALGQAGTSLGTTSDDALQPPQWAVEAARLVARANGNETPSQVQFARTTSAQAAAMIDETSSDGSAEVYVVVMCGDFTMITARLPRGVEPPHADWIMLILNPDNEGVVGMAFAAGAPDTTALGPTTLVSL
jgi:hypothetical protein